MRSVTTIVRFVRRWLRKRHALASRLQNFFHAKVLKMRTMRLAKENMLWLYWQRFSAGESHKFLWFNISR
jgi:hypothetical protein